MQHAYIQARSSCSSGRSSSHSSRASRSGAAKICVKRVVGRAAAVAEGDGQQMQVVIAERHRRRIAEGANAAQHLERGGPAIDQIADEPEPVAIRGEFQRFEQGAELRIAALHIADSVQRHRPPSAALRASPAGRARSGASNLLPVVGHHLVAALHGADRGFDDGAARVAKSLARLQVGLLAHDAVAAGFLHVAVRIRDDPVARQQARRHLALVADGDGVREHEALVARDRTAPRYRRSRLRRGFSAPGVRWSCRLR